MNALMFSAFMSLSSQSVAASLPVCEDSDASCLKLHIADQLLQLQDLAQQLAATKGQLDIAKMAEQGAINAATVSNRYAQKIEAETQKHWFDSPVLWLAVGFFIASGISIGLAAAFAHVAR